MFVAVGSGARSCASFMCRCWLARLLGSGTLGAGLPVADWVLGKEAGRELIRMTPEEVAKTVPNLPSRFPALVVSGTRNASWGTPLLPSNTSTPLYCRPGRLIAHYHFSKFEPEA